jgi:hypothetical protein
MKPDAQSFRLTDFTDIESSMEKFGKIQVRAEPYRRARALILEKTSVPDRMFGAGQIRMR